MLFSKFLQWEDIFLGLLLVTTALTTTTSPFEFPSLGANQRLDMRAGFASSSEMTVGSASGPSSWNWQKLLKLNSSIYYLSHFLVQVLSQDQAYDLPTRTLSYPPGFVSRYRLHKKARFCLFMTCQMTPFFMSHCGNFWQKRVNKCKKSGGYDSF